MSDIDRVGAHFPLGASLGPSKEGKAVRPFGLRFAVEPAVVVELDWERLGYDPRRQIAIVADPDGTLVPAMRHTSTRTKTDTSRDDRSPRDDDEDASGR